MWVKLILDYKAILLDEDPKDGQRILLLTKFASRGVVATAEPKWREILKKVSPNGAALPPGLNSAAIRTVIGSQKGIEPFSSFK
jgi:hypothetical protein